MDISGDAQCFLILTHTFFTVKGSIPLMSNCSLPLTSITQYFIKYLPQLAIRIIGITFGLTAKRRRFDSFIVNRHRNCNFTSG